MDRAHTNFATPRTQKLRAQSLSPTDDRTVGHIEEFGCSVISVQRTNCGLGWSYTIGIFDTCGKPEILTVGLLPKTAHHALNEAANLLRSGVDLTQGRHSGIVGEVDCEFSLVDSKWVAQLMGWAVWYYEGADFPVLQAIYPDLENRFPGDEGFDGAFEQPLLQPAAPMNRVEQEFWDSTDPTNRLFNWKFPESPHSAAYLSETVHKGVEEVTFVSHDEDGWQFLGDSMADGGGPVVCCLHHSIDKDPSLVELADLPCGWYAERSSVGEPWIREQRLDG